MKKTLCASALLVLLVMSAACSFKIFEDIGTDPHPPTVQITALIHYVAPVAPAPDARAALSPPGRNITWDAGGFTLSPGQQFYIKRSFSDAGGDVVKFHLRDRDGLTTKDLTPTGQPYFSGTSGALPELIIDPVTGESSVPPGEIIDLVGMPGTHRLEFWAEDSHLSRSEKVEFTITILL